MVAAGRGGGGFGGAIEASSYKHHAHAGRKKYTIPFLVFGSSDLCARE